MLARIEDMIGYFRRTRNVFTKDRRGKRPKLRSRLKDWTNLSLRTVRLRASTGRYADYRRLSKWRVGPKQKPRVYYAYREKPDVRSVGRVQLVFRQ